jgi:hypothetical protein
VLSNHWVYLLLKLKKSPFWKVPQDERKVVCDEGEFEDVSLSDDMHFEEQDVGATSPLQMQQNLHMWCNSQTSRSV